MDILPLKQWQLGIGMMGCVVSVELLQFLRVETVMQRTALLSRKGRYNCVLLSWFIYILPFTVCRQLTCIFDLSSDYLVRTTFRWGWRGWILETGGYGDDTRVSICCTQRCTTFRCIKNSTMDTTSQPTCFSPEHRNGERYLTIVLCGINIILTPITILFLTMPKQAQEITVLVLVVAPRSWQNSLELEIMIPLVYTKWLQQSSRLYVQQQTSARQQILQRYQNMNNYSSSKDTAKHFRETVMQWIVGTLLSTQPCNKLNYKL